MNKRLFLGIDWGLLVPTFVLVILSLATLFSINIALFKNQLFFFVLSILAYLFFSQVNYSFTGRYVLAIYIITLITLVLVLLGGIESRGAVRWFEVFGFRVQFSELLKPFLAISLSSYLASSNYSPKTFFLTIGFLLPITFLIFLQPDLGNALIYVFATILTLAIFGFSVKFFFAIFFLGGLVFPIFWKFLHEYQKQRILTFFNPTDSLGLSYNAIQSLIAVGAGGLFGQGLGIGSQSNLRFLPERHTDFIFASISESFGFVGDIVIILSFGFLLYRIYSIFRDSNETFCKIFSAVSFCLILSQFFINVGMNIGLIPIVGITLPFLSYGGSSLLSNFILLGLLSSMSRNLVARNVLEIK